MVDVIAGAAITDAAINGRGPVASPLQAVRRNRQGMCRRQPLDVAESRSCIVVVQSEQKKIGDGGFVQHVGDVRIKPNAIEGVAEKEEIMKLGVIERFDAKMIPRTKQRSGVCIPNGKCKITPQITHAFRAPGGVSMQDQY